jgi:hypothetical protein
MTKDERKFSDDIFDADVFNADIFNADIFNADDEAILSLNIGKGSLPCGTLAERGAAGSPDSSKRLREGDEHQSTKLKKSRREKLRREAMNDRFMELSALFDPTRSSAPLTTDKNIIVTKAAKEIKELRAELAKLYATVESMLESNLALKKESSYAAEDKAALQQDKEKLQNQLYCFMSSMPFASPTLGTAFSSFSGAFNPLLVASALDVQQKIEPNQPAAGTMHDIWNFPRLVVQSTTAEEDAKLRAPVA